jgi:hypothetical protein
MPLRQTKVSAPFSAPSSKLGLATAVALALTAFAAQARTRPELLAPPGSDDLARNLVDRLEFQTLGAMRAAGLEKAELRDRPWSGWYWPLNEGGLAARYADPELPTGASWPALSAYLWSVVGRGPVERLSPAEKYDLLLGDPGFGLTRAMLRQSDDSAIDGKIEAWLGYCTGWANAAMLLPRPVRSVTVLAADGNTRIELRPSDIKALGSLLWANASYPARLVGNLCVESPVRRDPVTGRPLDPRCRDTNPATFHLVLVNQIGAAGKSFLIDSDSGYQVWNQPVSSYRYAYFNPATGAPGTLEDSLVAVGGREAEEQGRWSDPWAAFRAPGTRYLIGVETHLTFIYEKRPSLASIDDPASDEQRFPIYRYDLEIAADGKILGGEWHSRLHPDLLWFVPSGARPKTLGDKLVVPTERWSPGGTLPPSWIAAANSSKRAAQPLTVLVEKLFEWSAAVP